MTSRYFFSHQIQCKRKHFKNLLTAECVACCLGLPLLLQCQIGLILCLCLQYIRPRTLRTFTWLLSSNMEDCFDGSFLTNNRTCKQQLKKLLFYLGLLEVSWRTAPSHWNLIKHAKHQNGSTSSFVDETRGKAFFDSTQKSITEALEFIVVCEEAIVPFLGVLPKRLHYGWH